VNTPAQATHVISYFPPYLLSRRSRRTFPDGMWDLQDAVSYEAGEPVTDLDSSMCGPGDTAPAHLASWAAAVLGYSVTLTAETVELRAGRVPFLRPWRTELVYYVTSSSTTSAPRSTPRLTRPAGAASSPVTLWSRERLP
jgi:hypothetical protein